MLEFLETAIPVITILIAIAASLIFISGIDDMFFDVLTLLRRVLPSDATKVPETPGRKELETVAEKPVAILVPAWQEANVIGRMLQHTIDVLNYSAYRIFVGVYPNDTATAEAAKAVEARHSDKIQVVTLDHDGPTNKSDNLNALIAASKRFEDDNPVRFEIFVLDDAEDIVPRDELKVINYFSRDYDVVQISVFPLKAKWYELTMGHYMDEFAELHLKDMPAREWLTDTIPSAGVGAGFSRRAMEIISKRHAGLIFNQMTLTEDYELPLELSQEGLRAHFVTFTPVAADSTETNRQSAENGDAPVLAIRECFPRRFAAAVRQKTRWVLGITMLGWQHLGWKGEPIQRYMLFRDRKALITNLVNVLGYILVFLILLTWLGKAVWTEDSRFPEIVPEGSWIWYLLILTFFIFAYRLVIRMCCTFRVYGIIHAVLSVPRAVWGNFINFLATTRAIVRFVRTPREQLGAIPWEKTEHEFPAGDAF